MVLESIPKSDVGVCFVLEVFVYLTLQSHGTQRGRRSA